MTVNCRRFFCAKEATRAHCSGRPFCHRHLSELFGAGTGLARFSSQNWLNTESGESGTSTTKLSMVFWPSQFKLSKAFAMLLGRLSWFCCHKKAAQEMAARYVALVPSLQDDFYSYHILPAPFSPCFNISFLKLMYGNWVTKWTIN